MEEGLKEAVYTIIGMICFFGIGYAWIKHLTKIDYQFKKDATNMVVNHFGYGKTVCLDDMKNGYVILENREYPVAKKYIKPVYF
jgi:hypothetical protein